MGTIGSPGIKFYAQSNYFKKNLNLKEFQMYAQLDGLPKIKDALMGGYGKNKRPNKIFEDVNRHFLFWNLIQVDFAVLKMRRFTYRWISWLNRDSRRSLVSKKTAVTEKSIKLFHFKDLKVITGRKIKLNFSKIQLENRFFKRKALQKALIF